MAHTRRGWRRINAPVLTQLWHLVSERRRLRLAGWVWWSVNPYLLGTWVTLFSVFVTQVLHSRAMDGEMWITSDGRAYLVDLRPADFGHQVSRTELSYVPVKRAFANRISECRPECWVFQHSVAMAWDLYPWFSNAEMGPEATTSWIWDTGFWGHLSRAKARHLRGHQYKVLIICIRDP